MVPMPSAESFQTLTRVWLDECERVAGSDHYRHDIPVIELFEAEKDHMLPLPGVRFDPCGLEEREGRQDRRRHDRREPVSGRTEMAFHALAGRGCASSRSNCGAPTAKRSPRWRGFGAIRRKPRWIRRACSASSRESSRIWGESPIRNDFPETVRVLLDRMDARTRSNLLDDIRAVAADCGFAATVKAVETVINAGRTVDRAAIGTCAKRILEGQTEGGQDLKRYDKYMKEAE